MGLQAPGIQQLTIWLQRPTFSRPRWASVQEQLH